MKKIRLLFYFSILLLFPNWVIAQGSTYALRGSIVDASQQNPLPGAHIYLTRVSDSLTRATISDESGRFAIEKLSAGAYALRVTFVGFEEYQQRIQVQNQDENLGLILLKESSEQLEQIEVVEKTPAAEQKGDTLQFNAKAYKTNPDANAEDLIRKMPGVVVENGKAQAQGEDVQQVLVDGKPFFGNDPRAALQNLPAEVIDKIQVFDQQSEQSRFTGFDDGETTKTINIITKTDKRNGQFGKVYAGYGYDQKYQAGGNVNYFEGDRRISLIGQSNNINQQNFSTADLVGALGTSGQSGRSFGGRGGGFRGRGRRGGSSGANINDFLIGQEDGISQTHALGLNYSDKWGEKVEVNGSYFFNKSDNESDQFLNRNFILDSDSSLVYQEKGQTNSQNINHRFNARLDYDINDRNSLLIRPSLTLQQNDGRSLTTGLTSSENTILSELFNDLNSDLLGIQFDNNLLFRHRFAKMGRTLSIRVRTGYNQNSGERFLLSEGDDPSVDSLDQFSDLLADGWNVRSDVTFTERIARRMMLMVNYSASYQRNDSDQETLDFAEDTQAYSDLNTTLSNTFESNYWTQGGGLGLRYFSRKLQGMVRVNAQWAQLNNEQIFPAEGTLQRNFFNVLPFAMLRYNISRSKNLRIFYRSNTNEPSVSQLQDVIDNSNPQQLSTGNPDLAQQVQHSIFTRYSSTNTDKSTVFFILLGGLYQQNHIANHTITDPVLVRQNLPEEYSVPAGTQLTIPVNLDGYWNLRSFITYGMPVDALSSNLNINISARYTRTPGLINDETNFAHNPTFGIGLTLSSNISERVDFTISSRSNYGTTINTLNTGLDNQYFNQNTEASLVWIFGNGWVFRSDVNHQLYRGLTDELNQDYYLWNASFGKKFLKNQRGELSVKVFDILGQNNSIRRDFTDAYIEDTQVDVLQTYAMLTFTYQIRNFRKSPEKVEDE